MLKSSAYICFIVLALWASRFEAQAQSVEKTVLEGVYSDAQAARGRGFYKTYCSACHGAALDGVAAPPLKGDRFIERWREGTLDPLYDFIRQRMPFGKPPTAKPIPDNEYLDIVTYILSVNEYRTGDNELTPALLESIRLVGKDGPKPVPDGALVLTVGCLAGADTSWSVTTATEPARTRREDTSPAEVNASSQKKPGTLTFRLTDLDAVPGFEPAAHNGNKLQVKGFLVRQPNAERINLTSIEILDSSCVP